MISFAANLQHINRKCMLEIKVYRHRAYMISHFLICVWSVVLRKHDSRRVNDGSACCWTNRCLREWWSGWSYQSGRDIKCPDSSRPQWPPFLLHGLFCVSEQETVHMWATFVYLMYTWWNFTHMCRGKHCSYSNPPTSCLYLIKHMQRLHPHFTGINTETAPGAVVF